MECPRLPDWLEYPSYAYELKERMDATEVNWKPIPTMAMHISRFVDGPDMDEVYPEIFLGDCDAAMNEKYLLSNGITHVLNCAANFRGGPACVKTGPDFYKDPSIIYHGLELIDLPFANITPHFEPGAAFIEKALQAGGRILVHCRQGRSRSASILIAFLMRNRSFTASNALVMLKETREIHPNSGFLKELADLDLKLFRDKFQKWKEVSSSESSDSSSDEENIKRRRKSPSENTKRNRILRAKLREQFMAVIPKNENSHKLKHEVAFNRVTNSPKLNRKGIADSPKPKRKVGESPNRKAASSPSRKSASSPKQARKEESSPKQARKEESNLKARKNSINKLPDANANLEGHFKEPEPAPPKQIIIPPPAKQYDDIIWSPSPSPPPTPNAPCTVGGLLMALARVGKTGNSTSGVDSPVPTPIEEEPPKAQENKTSSNLIQNAVVELKKSSESAIVSDVSKCKSITRTLTSKDIETSQSKELKDDVSSEILLNNDNCQSVDVSLDVKVNTDVSFDFTFDLENNKAHRIKPYKRTSSTTKLTIIQTENGNSNYTKSTKDSTDASTLDVTNPQNLNSSESQSSKVNHEVILTNTSNIPVHDKVPSTDYLNKLDMAVKQVSDIAATKTTSEEHFNKLDNAVDELGDIAVSMMNGLPPTQSETIYTDTTFKDSSDLTLKNSDLGDSSQFFIKTDNDNDEKQTKSAVNILSHVLSDAVILNGLPSEYDHSAEAEQDHPLPSPEKCIKSISAKKEENKVENTLVNKVSPITYSTISSGPESSDKDSIDDEKSAQEESVNAPPAPSGWRKVSKVITSDSWKSISRPLAPAPWKSQIESKGEVKSPSSNNKNFPQIQQSGPKGWKSVVTTSSPGSSRQSPASSRETSICRTRPSSPNKSTEQISTSPVVLSKPTIFNSISDSGEKTPVKLDNIISEEQRFSSAIESKSNACISQYQPSTSALNINIKNPQTTTCKLEVTKEKSATPSPQNERRRATCPEIHDTKSLATTPSENRDNHLSRPISDTKTIKYCQNSPSPEKGKRQSSPSPEKSRRNSSPSPDTKRRPSSPSPDPEPTKHRGSSPTNRRSRARQRPTGATSITEKQETAPVLNKWRPASSQRQMSPVNTMSNRRSSNTDSSAEVSSPGMNRYRPVSGQRQNSSEQNEIRRRPSATEESTQESSNPVLSRWRPNSRQRPTSPVRSSSITRRRPSLTESNISTTNTVTQRPTSPIRSSSITRRRPSLTESNTSTTNTVTGVRRRTSFNEKTSTPQEITYPVQLKWRPGSVQRSTSPVRSSSATRRRPPVETNMSNHVSSNSDSILRKLSISNSSTISTEMPTTNDTTNSGKSYNTSSSSSYLNPSNTTKAISGISKRITDQVDTKPPHASSEITSTQPQASSLSRSDSWRSRRRAISPDESIKKETQTSTSNSTYIPRTSSPANKETQSSIYSSTYSPQTSRTATTTSSRRPSSPEPVSSRFRSSSLQRPSSPESKPRWRSSTRDRPASPSRSYISPRQISPESYTSRYSSANYPLSNSSTITSIGSYRLRSVSRNRASSPDRSGPRGRPTSPTAFSQNRLRSVSRTRAQSPERTINYPSQRTSLASYGLAKSSSVTNLSMARRFPATASMLGSSTRNYSFTGSRYDSCSNLDRLDTNVERLRYKRY